MSRSSGLKVVTKSIVEPEVRSSLADELRRLILQLASSREEDSSVPTGDTAVLRWDDEENVYLEVQVDGLPWIDADLSFVDNRVLIRVGRAQAGCDL